jgi:hypothetical protein
MQTFICPFGILFEVFGKGYSFMVDLFSWLKFLKMSYSALFVFLFILLLVGFFRGKGIEEGF